MTKVWVKIDRKPTMTKNVKVFCAILFALDFIGIAGLYLLLS